MLSMQHGHYRPDQVTRTSVIEPYDILRYSPVEVARHTIDPFIYGVRPPGPAVAPAPTAEAVANAAAAVAESWSAGRPASIKVGGFSMKVDPTTPIQGGLVGMVQKAAHGIRTGKPVLIQSQGTPPVIAQARPGSQVVATGNGVAVKATPGPAAVVRPSQPRVSAGGAYPSTYAELTTAAAPQVPPGGGAPVNPSFTTVQLDRRTVPSWSQAGREAIAARATKVGATRGIPSVVAAASAQLATMRKMIG